MKKIIVYLMVIFFMIPPLVNAEGITKEQGDAILKELRNINQRLEKIEKLSLDAQKRGRPPAPSMAQVSTLGNPVLGDNKAPVTLVEFTDYQCPFCKRFFNNTFQEFKKKYIDTGKVRLVLRDMPLGFHAKARPAAKATHCAGEQNKYWEMHDALFEDQEKIKQGTFESFAEKISLDADPFLQCMKSDRYEKDIDKDLADAGKAQITGTPTFVLGKTTDDIIKGPRIVGAQPLAVFESHLQKLLKVQAEKPITN